MTRLSSTSEVTNGIPPRYPQNRRRTIHIHITRDGDYAEVLAYGDQFPDSGRDFDFKGRPETPFMDLKGAIDLLRVRWRENVIDRHGIDQSGNPIYAYAERMDQAGYPDMWRSVGLELARAGRQLFTLLFENGDPKLRILGSLLTEVLHSDKQIIRVQSDDLFVPWSMLYTPADPETNLEATDSQWSLDGFWGYSHLIEHTITQADRFDARIRPGDGGRLITGMIIDPRLDTDFPAHPPIAPLKEFFQDRTTVIFRETRDTLATHLSGRQLNDHISYFCCHASFNGMEQAYFTLGDGRQILATEISGWLKGKLDSGPIVFVNGCQGGKLASLFYTSFGMVLLKAGANCLIGPQIEVPPLFARVYALEFFNRFLDGGRIGDIVYELAREFADTLKNPLGLTVSLYRGLDTHLDPASFR